MVTVRYFIPAEQRDDEKCPLIYGLPTVHFAILFSPFLGSTL